MTVLNEIAQAIARNPKINRVIVSAEEWDQLRQNVRDMQFIKGDPRPTYGPPFGDIDRLLWDNLQELMKRPLIRIMGRPVEIRK